MFCTYLGGPQPAAVVPVLSDRLLYARGVTYDVDDYPHKPQDGTGVIATVSPEKLVRDEPEVFSSYGFTYLGSTRTRYAVFFLQEAFFPKDVQELRKLCGEMGLVPMPVPYYSKLEDYGDTLVVRITARESKDPKARAFLQDRVMMRYDDHMSVPF